MSPQHSNKVNLNKFFITIYEGIPSSIFCALANIRNKNNIRGKKHKLYPIGNKRLYKVTDNNNDEIIICRRDRHYLYKKGIAYRIQQLAKIYHLDHIECCPGDVMIDCGANVGELGFWAKERQLQYFPVEPEELEVECCNLNIFNGEARIKCRALWKENDTLRLYSKPNFGDSSLFEIRNYSTIKQIEAITLEKLVEEYNISNIHILKIEAEGAEPEILRGAIPILNKIKYITVDCGYERGQGKCT
ncbi:MAG: FkbM family methyltransferase [Desulfamplus sp.]